MTIPISRCLAAFTCVLLFASPGLTTEFDKFQLLKVAGQEQKAVVKSPDGKLMMIGVGDSVGEATITGIADGEVRLERSGEFGVETLIVHLDADGKQRIDRMEVQPLRSASPRGSVQAQ